MNINLKTITTSLTLALGLMTSPIAAMFNGDVVNIPAPPVLASLGIPYGTPMIVVGVTPNRYAIVRGGREFENIFIVPRLLPNGHLMTGKFAGHTGPVTSVAISRDSTNVVSASEDHTIRIWKLTGTTWLCSQTLSLPVDHIKNVNITPDGNTMTARFDEGATFSWTRNADGFFVPPIILEI